ncbi:MAG: serine/threonine protein kinase [Actinomycetota bacterium]|nr:serine/threonine protein kinase [Actinomycetota bacterium]
MNDAAVAAAFPELSIDMEPLGRGGMKNAYRGTQDGKDLVLKVVREPVEGEELEGAASLPDRLRREIDGMRAIDHPSIVKILDGPDVCLIDGQTRVWYIEPYYPGGTLADHIGEPHPVDTVLDLTSCLLEAVGELSAHGIVHRDIKPGNIVFDAYGQPVLLDLGIALFVDLTPLTNQFGPSPRTDRYATPEQFDLRSKVSFDARTDMFLVGMVAFEALTGQHPFQPESPDRYMERLLTGDVDESALDAVDAPPDVRSLLLRLLAPNRAHRFRKVEHALAAVAGCR